MLLSYITDLTVKKKLLSIFPVSRRQRITIMTECCYLVLFVFYFTQLICLQDEQRQEKQETEQDRIKAESIIKKLEEQKLV